MERILECNPKSILDMGCGEGWIGAAISHHLARYIGIDFSAALVERAQQVLPQRLFLNQSYEELVQANRFEGERFDAVVFNFSLFSEDIRPILRWVRQRLAANGTLLVQTLHPCFTLAPYQDGWREEDFAAFPLSFSGKMKWYGRTLGSWTTSLVESGFALARVFEPLDSNQRPASLILEAKPKS